LQGPDRIQLCKCANSLPWHEKAPTANYVSDCRGRFADRFKH
jgi:hypothetical protein